VRPHREAAPLEGIGERPADDRRDEHRDQFDETDESDGEGGTGEFV